MRLTWTHVQGYAIHPLTSSPIKLHDRPQEVLLPLSVNPNDTARLTFKGDTVLHLPTQHPTPEATPAANMPRDWEYMFDVDAWARDGLMTPEIILERLTHCMRSSFSSTNEMVEITFDRFSNTTTEPKVLPQSSLLALFASADTPLTLFPDIIPLLHRSLLYAAGIPFHNLLLGAPAEPSPPLTLAQFRRALGWLLPENKYLCYPMGSRCRARTPADERRALFQSLARGTDGARLPHDEGEARRRATQRAVDFPWWRESEREDARENRDDEGDEMFHHVLEVLAFCMPWDWDDYIPFAQPGVEKLLPLAHALHGDEVRLHHLSIDRADFRALVRWLVFLQVNLEGVGEEERLRGLDEVVECVVRTFCRDATAGVTYEMFEDGVAMLVSVTCLFVCFRSVWLIWGLGSPTPFAPCTAFCWIWLRTPMITIIRGVLLPVSDAS